MRTLALLLLLSAAVWGQVPRVGELDLRVTGNAGPALVFQARNLGGRRVALSFPAGMPFKGASGPTLLLENDLEISLGPQGATSVTVGAFQLGQGHPAGRYQASDDRMLYAPAQIVHTVKELQRQDRLRSDPRRVTETALAAEATRNVSVVPSELWADVENTLIRAAPGVIAAPEIGPLAFLYQVSGGNDSFGSSYGPNCSGTPFEGGRWGSAQGGADWAQRTFLGTHGVVEIQLRRASTDITTDGFRLAIKLQRPDGTWVTVDEVRDANVNRTQLSEGRSGRSIPDYRKRLKSPVPARAIRIEFSGHGWFDLEDVDVFATPLL